METYSSIDYVKEWMKELVREGLDINNYIKVTEEKGNPDNHIFRFTFYTRLFEYHIVAKQESNTDGYLGASCTCRMMDPGEDWNRGRDLKDGNLSRLTWEKIKDDILWHELVPISPFILDKRWETVYEDKRIKVRREKEYSVS